MSWWNSFRWGLMRVIGKDLLAQHPELENITPVLSMRASDQVQSGASNYGRAADDFVNHIWVQKAVRVWADSIAPLRVRVIDLDTEREMHKHTVSRLLANPNPVMSASDVWRWWATDMGLGGESGLEFVKNPAGEIIRLYPRQPDFFNVRPHPTRYRYYEVKSYILDPDSSNPWEVPPDEFLHFKFYNPQSVWRGLSPAAAVRLGVVIDQLVQVWSRTFFGNNARPDFAIYAKEGITKNEKREIEKELAEKFGADKLNSHKPIILENGITDVKTLSYPRKDLEWLDQRRFSRDEIGAIWNVPDEIMGFGRNTFENFDTAERVLWSLAMINLINFRDDKLNHFFRSNGRLDRHEHISTDISKVWALRRAAAIQMQDAEALARMGVPFNRIDELLKLGVGAIPGGDAPHPSLKPVASKPESNPSVPADDGEETQPDTEKMFPLKLIRSNGHAH